MELSRFVRSLEATGSSIRRDEVRPDLAAFLSSCLPQNPSSGSAEQCPLPAVGVRQQSGQIKEAVKDHRLHNAWANPSFSCNGFSERRKWQEVSIHLWGSGENTDAGMAVQFQQKTHDAPTNACLLGALRVFIKLDM